MKLASGVAPVDDCLERGINVALGTDGPPCNNTLDPFTKMRQASLLQKVDRLEPQALPARAVFEMATINGARAAGFERVGRLREGWNADVIGLETDLAWATPIHDALSHLVFVAHGDDVQFTMVDGEVLIRDGEVQVAEPRRSASAPASTPPCTTRRPDELATIGGGRVWIRFPGRQCRHSRDPGSGCAENAGQQSLSEAEQRADVDGPLHRLDEFVAEIDADDAHQPR